MKIYKQIWLILVLFITSLSLFGQAIPNDSLYLGRTLPGYTAKVFPLPFSPGLRPVERIAITSDGKEIYFGELDNYPPTNSRIKCYKYQNNAWQGPFTVFEGYMGPKLFYNDSIIYMQKDVNGLAMAFFAKRTNTGWTEPARLFKSTEQQHYFQKLKNGSCYLSSGPTSNREICKVEIINNDTVFKNLGYPVNSSNDENDFIVSEDESFIIFSRSNAATAGDMYISYKKNDGKWTNPKILGPQVNTPNPNWEYGQFLTSGYKYLFFTRGGNVWSEYNVYWVKIDNLIDSLKKTNYEPYMIKQIPNQGIIAGQPYNYLVSDSVFYDDDGNNTLTYTATLTNGNPLPSWLKFDPITHVFSGTPTETANLSINVTVKDSGKAELSCSFLLRVTKPMDVENGTGSMLQEYKLFNNYPNPFNPSTNIEFTISKKGKYTLCVYNTLGCLVKVISSKEFMAGHYKVVFDSTGLPSGVYICNLKGDMVNLSEKMIVLR